MTVGIRVVSTDDAEALADLLVRNRDFLAPWDPVREDAYFTADGQRTLLTRALQRYEQGIDWPGVVTVGDEPVGRVNLNNVVLGAFCSADLGAGSTRRATVTASLRPPSPRWCRLPSPSLGLHRVQAGTLLRNRGSQRVLERNGFTLIGMAPRHIQIAGCWQDHLLFQRLAD